MKRHSIRNLLAAGLVALALAPAALWADVYKFTIPLEGAQEPGGGDPDGSGLAIVFLDSLASTVSWHIEVADIDTVVAAHIHQAPVGVNGSIVIPTPPFDGGPVFDADVPNILADPSAYYLNVHTELFRGGAIRGQLSDPVLVPETSTITVGAAVLCVGLLTGVRSYRRRSAR